MSESKKGFTLLELSISALIIGLLLVSVTAGKNLMKNAELTKIIAQNNQFKAAYTTFRSAYASVPGDFPNGFSIWGTTFASSCTNATIHAATTGCNGDGSGDLNGSTSGEGLLMWRHLSFAGTLSSQFSIWTSGTKIPGTHLPLGARNGSGYYAAYDNYYGIVNLQDMFIFGATVSSNDPYGAILNPIDAKNIDKKMDDGHPTQGKVLSGTSPSGATGQCPNGSPGNENLFGATDYTVSNSAIACRMIFLLN
jgi:prepilin-type N-terminal cleavage/methylation domain-containing protein